MKMQLKPLWNELEKLRDKTINFLEGRKFSNDIINAICMVASELVENAIKYGNFKRKSEMISLAIDIEKRNIIIEVKNRINGTEEHHLKNLDETIQWIRGYQNPFEAYVEKLKEVSVKELDQGESGLGLVRIAYEGQSILDFYVNEENILAVSAIYEL
jgi:hypothetical protein